MAYRMFGFHGLICPIMDARRSQVYTGIYEFDEQFKVVRDQMAEDIFALAELLNQFGKRVVFLGDGVPVYRENIKETMKVPYIFAPPHMCRQSAAAVGAQMCIRDRYCPDISQENAPYCLQSLYLRSGDTTQKHSR